MMTEVQVPGRTHKASWDTNPRKRALAHSAIFSWPKQDIYWFKFKRKQRRLRLVSEKSCKAKGNIIRSQEDWKWGFSLYSTRLTMCCTHRVLVDSLHFLWPHASPSCYRVGHSLPSAVLVAREKGHPEFLPYALLLCFLALPRKQECWKWTQEGSFPPLSVTTWAAAECHWNSQRGWAGIPLWPPLPT